MIPNLKLLLLGLALLCGVMHDANTQQIPIIDVHYHTYSGKVFPERLLDGKIVHPDPMTKAEFLAQALEITAKYNVVYAITSGPTPALVDEWVAADPARFIPALQVPNARLDRGYLNLLRERARDGKLAVIGEIPLQYEGIAPDHAVYEVYFSLAEELDIPIAIHLGPGPRNVHHFRPQFRLRDGDPILLEDALIRHPDLRIYVMHAGWPFLDSMIAILHAFPRVYVDTSYLAYAFTTSEYYRYLKALVEAGFADRIMFGSDAGIGMVPMVFATIIERINAAEFLTPEQKRDIFYNNAARFFGFDRNPG